MATRTIEEIYEECQRRDKYCDYDLLEQFNYDLLLDRLPYELAIKFNSRYNICEDKWKVKSCNREDTLKEMKEYLPFLIDKIDENRGLSIARGFANCNQWIWLLGDDFKLYLDDDPLNIVKNINERYRLELEI